MKHNLSKRFIAICAIIFFTAATINFSDLYQESTLVHADYVGTFTETVDGIDWTYEVFQSYRNVFTAEYVKPTDKTTLPNQVTIPDTLGGYPVTCIGSHAFSNSNITSITIPDTVRIIEISAFADCTNLTFIKLPSSPLYTVYDAAFKNCKALTSISVGDTSPSAFEGCSNLKTVNFAVSAGTTTCSISDSAFKDCTSLSEINFDSSYTDIHTGTSSFSGCTALKSITFNGNLIADANSFLGCTKLSNLTFNGTVTANPSSFANCTALTNLTFTKDAHLEYNSFTNCTSLKSVTFNGNASNTAPAPGTSPFANCSSLTKITFNGDTVDFRFIAETMLKEIYFNNTKNISGCLNNMSSLDKIVFNTINPNLNNFAYYASTISEDTFNIIGYRESSATSSLECHDTVYKWAKASNLTSSFVNIINNIKAEYSDGQGFVGTVPDPTKVKVSVSYYDSPNIYKVLSPASGATALDGYQLVSFPSITQYGANEFSISYMNFTSIKGTYNGLIKKASSLSVALKSDDKFSLDTSKGQHIENGILTLVEGQSVSLDMFDITNTYNDGTITSISENTALLSQCKIGSYSNIVPSEKSEVIQEIPITYHETLENGTTNSVTANIPVKFIRNKVESITASYSVPTLPVNSLLDTSKIHLTASYTDGSKIENISQFTLNSNIISSLGENLFTITYNGISTTFTITGTQDITTPVISTPAAVLISLKNLTIKLNKISFYKSYKNRTTLPIIKLTYNDTLLTLNEDYTLKYSKNNKYGKAEVIITGIGKYTGTIKKIFYILPSKTIISKYTICKYKNSKVVKIIWKKQKGIHGYQLVYSTSKKGTYKNFSQKKASDTSGIFAFSKNTVYVKIRAYIIINGKIKYGLYSTPKKIKIQ